MLSAALAVALSPMGLLATMPVTPADPPALGWTCPAQPLANEAADDPPADAVVVCTARAITSPGPDVEDPGRGRPVPVLQDPRDQRPAGGDLEPAAPTEAQLASLVAIRRVESSEAECRIAAVRLAGLAPSGSPDADPGRPRARQALATVVSQAYRRRQEILLELSQSEPGSLVARLHTSDLGLVTTELQRLTGGCLVRHRGDRRVATGRAEPP